MAIIPTVMFGDKKEQLLMSTLLSKGVNLSWLWCFFVAARGSGNIAQVDERMDSIIQYISENTSIYQ